MNRSTLILFASLIAVGAVYAAPPEDTGISAVVAEISQDDTAAASQADAMDQVAAALSDYLRRQGAPEDGGVANRGGVSVQFARGMATAAVPPGSSGFSDARGLAFERAFQNALGEMALSRDRRITTSVLSGVQQNTTSAAELTEACRPNASQAIMMKARQLFQASMDAALRKLDVPEEDIRSERLAFRCDNPQFRDFISTSTRTSAVASLRGVRIVKSVAIGSEVGVVIAVSPNFVAAAQSMARGETARNPLPTVVEEITAELADLKPADLLGEYGVRLARLSNGETAVIAFGQAGANVVPNDVGAIRSGKRRAAQSAAQRAAEAQLVQYGKVTTYFVSEEKRHASVAQNLVVSDGVPTQEQTERVGRELLEQIRSTGELRLQGAMIVKRWTMQDPDSADQVEGVVLAWSPSMAGGMQAATQPTRSGSGQQPAQTGPSRKLESRDRKEDW